MNSDYFKFLRETRALYQENWTGLQKQDPYKFGDFLEYSTPIESNVWLDCRTWGLEMYPQFPVGKYYLDFANPFYKIAIEADGKIHNHQKEKDASKDYQLAKAGWEVYRVDGWQTYKKHYDYFEEGEWDEKSENLYTTNSSEYLVRELAYKYRRQPCTDNNQILTTEEIIKQIEKDKPRRKRQKMLNEYLFGYEIPQAHISYKAE